MKGFSVIFHHPSAGCPNQRWKSVESKTGAPMIRNTAALDLSPWDFRDETHLPAFGYSAQTYSRFSGSHEDSRRAGRDPGASGQRSQATGHLSIRSGPVAERLSMQARAVVKSAVTVKRPVKGSPTAAFLLRLSPAARTQHLSLSMSHIDPARAQVRPPLFATVPKRLLVRAVDRNQLKRLMRSCWQEAPSELHDQTVLFRLVRRPEEFSNWPSGERRRRWRTELQSLIGLARSRLRPGLSSGRARDSER
jgi:ribonuclease P protein component